MNHCIKQGNILSEQFKSVPQFSKSILKAVPQWIQHYISSNSEIILFVAPKNIIGILSFLKNNINSQYKVLIDITAVDYPTRNFRFELVYNLLSIQFNNRIRIKTSLDELTPVSSVTEIFCSAGWWEREVWDMFGIFFSNHPDLRRILTDYGFQGYPLRKDFPLSGYVEVRYDDSEKRVITEPIELTQEFRYFDFASPWEQFEKK